MSYQVIARKWRPQSFDEIVGQLHVTRTLKNAIESGRVAHAFLFSGVRGVGKTTMARVLAKALNCHQGPTVSPCGECPSCLEIAAGNSIDVQEIDAASNTGVDNIRELRENTRYATARDRYKIFIIDEVHMLSTAAFNALLKTLEEPPPHVIFIMATTEVHKVPATILSRVQLFDFKTIPLQAIVDRLRLIVSQEGIAIGDDALAAIARSAGGSLRDAQSALDQVIAFSGKQISEHDIETILGVVGEPMLNEFSRLVHNRDAAGVLGFVNRVAGTGVDLQHLIRQIEEHFRNLLVYRAAGELRELFVLSAEQLREVAGQARWYSEIELLRIAEVLARTRAELRWSPHPRFSLELGLLKLVYLPQLTSLEDLLRQMGEQAAGSHSATSTAVKPAPSPARAGGPAVAEAVTSREWRVASGSADEFAGRLLEQIHAENPALSSFLANASVIELRGDELVVQFGEKESFYRDFVTRDESREVLCRICGKIRGAEVRLRVESSGSAPSAPPSGNDKGALDNPVVKKFIEKFPGKINFEKMT